MAEKKVKIGKKRSKLIEKTSKTAEKKVLTLETITCVIASGNRRKVI